MNANDARELTHKANIENADSQYARVQEKILNAAKNGERIAYFIETLKTDVHAKLNSDGFKITVESDVRRGIKVTISW
jgi:hypothetical protein